MRYEYSLEWTEKARNISGVLGYSHICPERIACIISQGTKTRRTVARIHTLAKSMQMGMQSKSFYTIELIHEKFSGQSEEDKTRTIIHELMHIPKSFGGGFRHHKNYVTHIKVEDEYKRYCSLAGK